MIRPLSARCALLFVLLPSVALFSSVGLASTIPIPKPRPASPVLPAVAATSTQPGDLPVKEAAPIVPVPKPRPLPTKLEDVDLKVAKLAGLPGEEVECRNRLTAMGVHFSPAGRIDGADGCGIAYPIKITGLPGGVKLSGRTVLGCEASEALASWTTKVVVPQAKKQFGKVLTGIDQYANYVCRTRNSQNGTKLSEHAKGNAIDLGRFHLSDGTVVDVGSEPDTGTPEQLFLKVLRDEGCAYFTTVLGPGSDDFHSDHFHFDMAKRRRGYRYCK
ncbi:MAG: extensin family protein [Hyphomicrobiales bacterium]|nr:extensin family protein [Hyphomicrobiales bacterium]MCP4998222.1 extensin family protein [Hyphomicrobiales bacterium]